MRPALIADGKVLPLDRFFAQAPPAGWPDWHPALRELQRGADGSTSGVPCHVGPMMLLYRADPYDDPAERAGFAQRSGYQLAAPDTWGQYLDQASAVTAGSRRPEAAYNLLRALTSPGMDRITAEEGGTATRRVGMSGVEFLVEFAVALPAVRGRGVRRAPDRRARRGRA